MHGLICAVPGLQSCTSFHLVSGLESGAVSYLVSGAHPDQETRTQFLRSVEVVLELLVRGMFQAVDLH